MILTNKGNSPMDKEALIQAVANSNVAAKVSSNAMAIGGGTAVYGWFTMNEWCALIGASSAFIFGTITVVIRYKTYMLLKEEKVKEKEFYGKGIN